MLVQTFLACFIVGGAILAGDERLPKRPLTGSESIVGKKSKNNFYAYAVGSQKGITASWPDCEGRVKGKSGARFKGFPDRASAEAWLAGGGRSTSTSGGRSSGKVYAYWTPEGAGIAASWPACQTAIRGHKGARYKGFESRAAAEAWLAAGARYEDKVAAKKAAVRDLPEDAVFFDAGTGAGRGTEVKVVDRGAVPIIHLAGDLPGTLTAEGTLLLGHRRTNNYGELLGCLLALRAAEKLGSRHIFGDSKLVLEYWSKGHVNRETRAADPDVADLADETARARRKFEAGGGRLAHVSGSINPADLGFHRD